MRVSTNAPPSSSTSSPSNFEFQQMAAALEDKTTLTFRNEMNEMKNMMKTLVPTPVPIKVVEERCTPFEGNEMIIEEEIEEFLKHDESLNMDLNDEFNDEEGDVTYMEKLLEVLNDDPFSPITPLEFKKEDKNVESLERKIKEDFETKDEPKSKKE
ncbi:hypothetical protein Tco_1128753, partial [Tanacetum coccineum]